MAKLAKMFFDEILKEIADNKHETNLLNMSDWGLDDDDAIALAEALKSNTTATRIKLENNKIGPKGAKALAEVLGSNTRVTDLDLSSINIFC